MKSAINGCVIALAATFAVAMAGPADAQDKGREAVEAVSEVRDNVAVAIDKSLKKRPYTTLALTLGVGFVLGAMWAR